MKIPQHLQPTEQEQSPKSPPTTATPAAPATLVRRAVRHPHLATPKAVLQLQQHYGNAATRRLFARKNTVQRLLLGPNQEFNTKIIDHYQDIIDHLETLDYDSLQYVRGLLQQDTQLEPIERHILEDIAQMLKETDDIRDINQHAQQQQGGIWTKATLFYGNNYSWETGINPGLDEPGGYSYSETGTRDNTEERLSARDSEVGTLDQMMDHIQNNPPDHSAGYVKIVMTGNIGPCDGCKERLERFKTDVEEFLGSIPLHLQVTVISHYTTPNQTWNDVRGTQHQHPTTYGYGDSQSKLSHRGAPYWEKEV